MLHLRKRGRRFSIWGEHCGVKVQESTGLTDRDEAEKVLAAKVLEIEIANPALATAHHAKVARIQARKAPVASSTTTPIVLGDWSRLHLWTMADACQVYRDAADRSGDTLGFIDKFEHVLGDLPLPKKKKHSKDYIDKVEAYANEKEYHKGRDTWANSTYNNHSDMMRAVLRYVENNAVEFDASCEYKMPQGFRKSAVPLKDSFLSEEHVENFLDVVKQEKPQKYPVYVTLTFSGARPVELARLKWSDVYMRNRIEDCGILFWHQKGMGHAIRKRVVPMHPRVHAELDKVDASRREGYVFRTEYGLPYSTMTATGNQRSPEFSGRLFAKLRDMAGLPKGTVCYDLRHTFASWLRSKGEQLDTIQKLLGHADIRTTQRYAHLHPDDLSRAVGNL